MKGQVHSAKWKAQKLSFLQLLTLIFDLSNDGIFSPFLGATSPYPSVGELVAQICAVRCL